MLRSATAALLVIVVATCVPQARAEMPPSKDELPPSSICDVIEGAAAEHGLPVGFFTRLIWKESRFRDDAVSPKGAQGIAQFMPGTATERGLLDPFDAGTAIYASASLLSDLSLRFGNLGLAAAAYNAGANRVAAWLDGGTLPWETQDYVQWITGSPAEDWADGSASLPAAANEKDCDAVAIVLKAPGDATIAPETETARAPWGVQVAGNFSKARALRAFVNLQKRHPGLLADFKPMIVGGRTAGRGTRGFYRVRVPVETREAGEDLCRKLRGQGGDCVVLKT